MHPQTKSVLSSCRSVFPWFVYLVVINILAYSRGLLIVHSDIVHVIKPNTVLQTVGEFTK